VLQPQRVKVFNEYLTTLLVSLGSSFFVVRLYLFLESDSLDINLSIVISILL
jgi:hypothetical protein